MKYGRRLSRLERMSLFNLYALIAMVEELIVKWTKYRSIDEDERVLFETALTSLVSAIRLYESKLDEDMFRLLKSEVRCVQSTILPLDRINKIKSEKDTKNISVSRQSLDTLAAKALSWCDPCDVKDHKECELRKVFQSLQVEPLCYEADGTCEYLYKKKSGKKGVSNLKDFLEYCKFHHFIPTPVMIEKFEVLLMYNQCYWDKNVLPEKVFRKFLQYIVPELFGVKESLYE